LKALKPIHDESYSELNELLKWFAHFGPIPILIGGWAVYLYNSYLGSIDIDIVGESLEGSFADVVEQYERAHGYEFLSKDPLGLEIVSRKPVVRGGRVLGHMEIDACTVEDPGPSRFNEDESKRLPYSLCLIDQYRHQVELSADSKCYLPCKSLLLLYKLKAARDRSYDLRIGQATLPAERVDFLKSKLTKDLADIVALMDPAPASHLINDSLNPEILGKIISEFSLGFALDTVRDLPNNAEALSLYNPNARPSDVQAWLKNSFPLDTHF
jgi:hypothetical protein